MFNLRGKRINFENVIRFYTHLSIYNNKLIFEPLEKIMVKTCGNKNPQDPEIGQP